MRLLIADDGKLADYQATLKELIASESSKERNVWQVDYDMGYIDGLKKALELLIKN